VKISGQPFLDVPEVTTGAIVQKWLTRILETYPEQTSRFLLETKDPFRNPVGRVLKENLPVILEEFAGEFDRDRIQPALGEIMHVRAVQDFTPGQAVGFVFLLRRIIREESEPKQYDPEALEKRIDELALIAFDLYSACRDKMSEIKVDEAKRRVFVLERMANSLAPS
jgi:hypothetical protein